MVWRCKLYTAFECVIIYFLLSIVLQLTTKRVGVMRTSAVEEFTKSINDDLYARLNTYVSSVEEAVQKLRYMYCHANQD